MKKGYKTFSVSETAHKLEVKSYILRRNIKVPVLEFYRKMLKNIRCTRLPKSINLTLPQLTPVVNQLDPMTALPAEGNQLAAASAVERVKQEG